MVTGADPHQWAVVRENELIALETTEPYRQLVSRRGETVDDGAAVFLAGTAGGLYKWTTGYQRLVLKTLNENVRYVEIEPERGSPAVRVASPQGIAWLRGILASATWPLSVAPADAFEPLYRALVTMRREQPATLLIRAAADAQYPAAFA